LASKAARRGIETEDRLIRAINHKDLLGNKIIEYLQNYFKTTYKQVSASKARTHRKTDIIISCDYMNIGVSVKEYEADYNHLERNFVDYYSTKWQMSNIVYEGLKQFVGEVDDHGRPVSIDFIENEAKQLNTSPGKLTKNRRKSFNCLGPQIREEILKFFKSNKEKIIKDLFVDEESIQFFIIVRREKNEICYYILPTEKVLTIYANGDVRVTRQGNLQLGKVVLQRKGGNHKTNSGWEDKVASQLQFKIKPSVCTRSCEPIFCETLKES
jgi:hypothetical protein